jgi:hypothetical protein
MLRNGVRRWSNDRVTTHDEECYMRSWQSLVRKERSWSGARDLNPSKAPCARL